MHLYFLPFTVTEKITQRENWQSLSLGEEKSKVTEKLNSVRGSGGGTQVSRACSNFVETT